MAEQHVLLHLRHLGALPGQRIEQPLLGQQDVRRLVAQQLPVFLPIGQGHRRVQAHQFDAVAFQALEHRSVPARGRLERLEEPQHLQRFAVGQEGREEHLVAQPRQGFDQVGEDLGFEEPGEGILHQDHAALALLRRDRSQRLRRGGLDPPARERGRQAPAAQQRAVHHPRAAPQQRLGPLQVHHGVVEPGGLRQPGDGEFERADQVVLQRAQVAAVIKFEKARAERRHIDLDRALPAA
ncbi:hypothetical protein FQZ97_648530 [compost metagenome]